MRSCVALRGTASPHGPGARPGGRCVRRRRPSISRRVGQPLGGINQMRPRDPPSPRPRPIFQKPSDCRSERGAQHAHAGLETLVGASSWRIGRCDYSLSECDNAGVDSTAFTKAKIGWKPVRLLLGRRAPKASISGIGPVKCLRGNCRYFAFAAP